MHDLQLVGLHDDGEHLVLTGSDGQRYRVRIDEPLRAAVRRDRARLGQLQIEVGTHLRPADIQARIRAGQDAGDVAAAAGVPVEHVRRYEGPVLAERQHVADRARRVQVRGADGARAAALGDLVAERLGTRGVQATGATWDSWRRQDGTWTVELSFNAGGRDRRARWTFDLPRSSVSPQDDEARWLSQETGPDNELVPGRRLSAVTDHVYDVEADGGVRPAEPSTGSADDTAGQRQDGAHAEEVGQGGDARARSLSPLELLDALRERRGRRSRRPRPDDDEDLFDDPDILADLLGDPPPAHPAASRPQDADDAEILELPPDPDGPQEAPAEPGPASASGTADDPGPDQVPAAGAAPDSAGGEAEPDVRAPEHATQPDQASQPGQSRAKPPATKAARAKRASVPSWDEIVFGAKKD